MADCYCLTKAQKFAFLRVTEAFSSVKTGIKNTSGMMWKLVAAGEVLSLPRFAVGSLLQNAQIVLEQKKVQQSDARSLETSSWNVPSVEKEAVLPQQGSNAKDAEHSKVSGNALTQSPVALQQPEHSNAKGIAASESAGESPQKTTQEGKITLPPDPAPQWDAPAATPPQSTFVTAAAAQDPLAEHPAYLLGQQPSSSGVGAHSGSNVLSAADSQAVPEGMHQLLVLADMGDCWMSFEPDGKKQQRMLRKGDSMTMTFRDALQLRLGNAAAVRLTYDGHEIDRSSVAKPVNMSFPPAE